MDTIFDIFGRLPDGKPMWVESLVGLDKANERVRQLGVIDPREYFIYSETDGIQEIGEQSQPRKGDR